MFCIRQYLSKKKKEKREKNKKKWDLVFIQKSYMSMYKKKVEYSSAIFLVSCDSRVGPVSQTAISEICSRWYNREYLKHTL